MNTKKLLGTGVLLSAAMMFAPLAFADDMLTVSGAICDAASGANSGKVIKGSTGVRNNSGTPNVFVTCPLTRDNPLSSLGAFDIQVAVSRSQYATANLVCVLSSRYPNGNSVASQTLSFSGVGETTLDFKAINNVVNGNYVVSCMLPEYSVVRSIFMDEL